MTGGATGPLGALVVAVLAAALDLAAPAPPAPPGARRLLRAVPAGALAVGLRLAGGPPLAAAALLAFAASDASALDGREPGAGGWAVTLLAQLLLAAAVWELASAGLLLRAPWRAAAALAVLAGGLAVWRSGRAPRGELAALAPVSVLLLAVAAAGAGAQPFTVPALAFAAAALSRSAATGSAWLRAPGSGPGRAERALRSAAALALAWPFLRPL